VLPVILSDAGIHRGAAVVMPQFDYSFLKSVGTDVIISATAEIRRPDIVSIGSHVAIDTAYITTAADIADYVHIGPYVTIIGGPKARLVMGRFTNLAAGARVICGSDRFMGDGLIGPASIPDAYKDRMKLAPVVLEDFANVGTNAVLMPGVTLAQGCVIGACSLVTHSTHPWTVYVGVPARAMKGRPSEQMLRYAAEMGYVIAAKQK
jgi:acetyltransferase-like isoleucine patch superfamily enzyme